jgi:hypothetical protein
VWEGHLTMVTNHTNQQEPSGRDEGGIQAMTSGSHGAGELVSQGASPQFHACPPDPSIGFLGPQQYLQSHVHILVPAS